MTNSFNQKQSKSILNSLFLYLQPSCIICFCFSAALSLFWFYTEPILILLHQDPHISATVALYMKYLIPGLFAYGFLQNIFLYTNLHTYWYGILFGSSHTSCLKGAGFSCESFSYVLVNLKLPLPSAGMVCFEHWPFEILVLLAGLMPNSQITTPLLAICVNTSSVAYMLTYGLSAAACTRVSNELGAGQVDRAKNAMVVALKLFVFVIIVAIAALGFGRNAWAGLFNDSIIIKKEFASMVPFLAASIAVDAVQGVLLGVTRGCGWQHLIVYTNLATYYVIGIPIACLVGFKLKLTICKGFMGWLDLRRLLPNYHSPDEANVSINEEEKNSSLG